MQTRRERDPRIESEEKFVASQKFDNDIDRYIDANEKGASFADIAKILCMKVQEVEARYAKALQFLRQRLK